ncbi:MAG: hypothetical protein OXN17_08375 [Candidatus Poribacteria bacterium]|nr:hypothetical protein [Candidatus Poribacteria bacterium]MDE0506962.1 hypothetical protein [Candidatus Poribacteria bacterium]
MSRKTVRDHVHEDFTWLYFTTIVIILVCATLKPVHSDINRMVRSHHFNTTLNKLADRNLVYLFALWPNDDEFTSYRIDLSTLPPTIVEHAASWIRRVVKHEWLPTEMQFIAMKDWKRRERRVLPRVIAYGVIVDALITEFSLRGYNFQIQDDGKHLGVLIFPVKPNQIASSIEDHITNSISKFFNISPSKLGSIEFTLKHSRIGANEKIYYGDVWCDWDKQKNTSCDAFKSQTWWNHMVVCTDGNFIYLHFDERLPNPNRHPRAISFTTEHNPRF